ncbi:sensor histidine kinase [Undibacterium sp. Ji22W]|uniref:sensor histidine kinase n=1 Tax=Undibacterium sp. Ji22W TaxID=3413038 RepID=UPI003BF41DB9
MHAETFYPDTDQQRKHIGSKIVLVVLVYTIVVASIVTGIQIYRAYQLAFDNLEQRFVEIENSYLPSLAAGLWSVDMPRIEALLDGIAKVPDVGSLRLQGELQDSWERKNPGHNKTLAARRFQIVYREGQDDFVMGTLYVELMAKNIENRMWDTATSIAITTTVSLLMSALFVLFIIRRWIGRHLEKTANYLQQLDLSNLECELTLDRPKSGTQDELDLVVFAINAMRTSIKNDIHKRDLLDKELVLYREQLEQLVAERTLDLQNKTVLLETKSEELILQNRELDAYAHTVAHDLKQPISNLMGASTLLTAENLELSAEKNRALLASIQQSSKKMHAIIDSLLLLASVRKNDNLKLEKINLEHTAHEAYQRLFSMTLERHAHVAFTGHWPYVMANPQWVEEVWVNYLSNAIKYGGDRPEIEIGVTNLANGFVKCWVQDSGIGLNLEQQGKLFEQFIRLDAAVSEGHGLGLSIVQRIVHKLGGEVGYERSLRGGSIFWFTLALSE